MSSSEESDIEEDSYNNPELRDFIVDDEKENQQPKDSTTDIDQPIDRITQMTAQLKPNETQSQKLLKAHIAVLVSALGGIDHTSSIKPAPYKLGHDALACLKDLRRWIKSIDETNNSYDVALACAESGLVINDLIVILCQWERQNQSKEPIKNARTTERIMLSCLELLVLLTWPVELNEESSLNQKLLYSNIKKYQILYKKSILSYNNGQTLKSILRLALPTLSKERNDREPRDNSILRLVLFFFRNILFIEAAKSTFSAKSSTSKVQALSNNLPAGITLDDISINVVLSAFKRNKVLMFLLTMSNLVGTEFDKDLFGPVCIECVYLIIKGIKPLDLLNNKFRIINNSVSKPSNPAANTEEEITPSITTTSGMQLQDMLANELNKKKVQTQNISTRHGRFGTLLSIRSTDANSYVVSGQDALYDMGSTFDKLDKSKSWKNRSTFKYDSDEFINTKIDYLTNAGNELLYTFINNFLTGGCFNNLIESIGSILTSNSSEFSNINEYEKATYFLTLSWFYNYKRERNNLHLQGLIQEYQVNTSGDDNFDKFNYGSVGAGLSEVNFILIISYFRTSYDLKLWSSLHVAMTCFKELLLISNSTFSNRKKVTENDNDHDDDTQEDIDRELGEGIIRKLFTFNFFISLVIQTLHKASSHSPDYLNVCISVIHILLKSFETFANEDIKIYVQYKRKLSNKNKKSLNNLDKENENALRDVIDGSDDEENNERIKEISKERQLDFKQTELRFFHTSIIGTYIDYLSRYEDLTHEEIKRCISYFHRLFVIRKDFGGLYRLDFMQLLQKVRNYLPKRSSVRNHVEEFIYYFMKKFKVALARFPNPIELLFPRFDDVNIKTYLTTGELFVREEKAKRTPKVRLAKELEFTRDNFSDDEKIKILITAIYEIDTIKPVLDWLTNELSSILEQMLLDASKNSEDDVDDNTNHISEHSLSQGTFEKLTLENSYVRLLLQVVGFELPLVIGQKCKLKSNIQSSSLSEKLELIKKWINNQPVVFDDNKDPSYFVREREWEADYDDEYDDGYGGEYEEGDDSIAFETSANPNSTRKDAAELDALEQLERSLEGSQRPAKSLSKGKALKKKKHRSEERKKKKKHSSSKSRRRRPPKSFSVDSEDEAPLKSTEFVHDSDDESDDEKDQQFYERENHLRKLLTDSGGIVNAQQLEEFKKVWVELENGSGGTQRVNLVRQQSSLFVDNLDSQEVDHEIELPLSSQTASDVSDADTTNIPEVDNSQTSSDNEEEATTSLAKKRSHSNLVESDDEDDSDNDGAEATFVSAQAPNDDDDISVPTRKKRLVIDDEDDE
ncbi:topoisomerase 1-associated factor 1 [Scheffersomyces coipomensis]|uniref:topoisomerase 1-associated factor 1 n=1 Tax=Scheffersomyces coipomensis TaxID=1788519 RepID=UPI00315CD83F